MSQLKIIKSKLDSIEEEFDIKILFACESGSRAWGFPSPDSDFDVRFIYAHPSDWYLSILENRDVVEKPIDAELDINGWDVRKSLRMIGKHNTVLSEWIQSPIIYRADKKFTGGFKKCIEKCFSHLSSFHHYQNMSKRYIDECAGEKVKLKKYFYCLRTTLSALWIVEKQSIPPIELHSLLSLIKSEKLLVKEIESLVKLKSTKDESYLHPKSSKIESFLRDKIRYCINKTDTVHPNKSDYGLLDEFFRKTIMK